MYIDQNEIVRIRVEADEFYDDEPGPPKAAEGVQVRREQGRAPFSVIVSVALFFSLQMCGRRVIVFERSARWPNKDLDRFRGGSLQKQKRKLWMRNDSLDSILLKQTFHVKTSVHTAILGIEQLSVIFKRGVFVNRHPKWVQYPVALQLVIISTDGHYMRF
jgi:hypothetical protein